MIQTLQCCNGAPGCLGGPRVLFHIQPAILRDLSRLELCWLANGLRNGLERFTFNCPSHRTPTTPNPATAAIHVACSTKLRMATTSSTQSHIVAIVFKIVQSPTQVQDSTQGCHADVFGRTMAAGASVTWTHCSVLFEVTWGKTRCIRADTTMRPRGHERVCTDATMHPCGRWGASLGCIRADVGVRRSGTSARTRKKNKNKK
jgi:hypothetical protein